MDNPADGTQATEETGSKAPVETGAGAGTDSSATTETGTKFDGPEWMSSMPDDIKSSVSLTKFKDIENLARGYMNAERLLGRDKIPMPKTDEEFADVYAKLGCPTDIKDYQIKVSDEGASKELKKVFKADLETFLPVAKQIGLNNKQASAVFGAYTKAVIESNKAAELQQGIEFAKAEAEIRAEYGEATDVKLALANRVISQLGGEDVANAIAASGLGRNPKFVRMMVKLGERHAEELGIDKTGNSNMATPSTLKQQIADLQASTAYWDATHPEHKLTVERVTQLFMRLTPS